MLALPRIQPRASEDDSSNVLLSTDRPRFQDLLTHLFQHRGVSVGEEAVGQLTALHAIDTFTDLSCAVETIGTAVMAGKHVCIVGDYDADGATSTALVVRALKQMRAKQVSYLIPSRFADGYGLSVSLVDAAVTQGAELIITVDNGITSIAAVDHANQLGVPVVVTDHHQAGATLPNAAAVVNPNRPDCDFPSKHLAGVGVAFYVMAALRSYLLNKGWFDIEPPKSSRWLDLVALGTVADVVSFDQNNRILVEYGLRLIRREQCAPIIAELLKRAGRAPQLTASTDLGFIVAPRLNAAGRLEDMRLSVEALLAEDQDEVKAFADQLETINQQRKEIELSMREEASILAQHRCEQVGSVPDAFCFYKPTWHQGVIGLVASRLRESFNRPVAVFAQGEKGVLKGSIRSMPGVPIRDVLAGIDEIEPGLLKQYGGHAMAGGLAIAEQDFAAFIDLFEKQVRIHTEETQADATIDTDGPLPTHLINLGTAKQLRLAAPWGKDFPEPVFDGVFRVVAIKILKSLHLRLELETDSGQRYPAIGFGMAAFAPAPNTQIRIAYSLEVNSFRGRESLQLMIYSLERLHNDLSDAEIVPLTDQTEVGKNTKELSDVDA